MKFITLFSILLATNAFAGTIDVRCNKLINGNNNGKAYTTAKSADFHIVLNAEEKRTEIEGSFLTIAGQYHRENDLEKIFSYFTEGKKVSREGDLIVVESFERNFWLCGSGGPACRTWETLTYNTKTSEATFEESHSYKNIGGDKTFGTSIKFSCK